MAWVEWSLLPGVAWAHWILEWASQHAWYTLWLSLSCCFSCDFLHFKPCNPISLNKWGLSLTLLFLSYLCPTQQQIQLASLHESRVACFSPPPLLSLSGPIHDLFSPGLLLLSSNPLVSTDKPSSPVSSLNSTPVYAILLLKMLHLLVSWARRQDKVLTTRPQCTCRHKDSLLHPSPPCAFCFSPTGLWLLTECPSNSPPSASFLPPPSLPCFSCSGHKILDHLLPLWVRHHSSVRILFGSPHKRVLQNICGKMEQAMHLAVKKFKVHAQFLHIFTNFLETLICSSILLHCPRHPG